jgi:uncharacterized membrane protein
VVLLSASVAVIRRLFESCPNVQVVVPSFAVTTLPAASNVKADVRPMVSTVLATFSVTGSSVYVVTTP